MALLSTKELLPLTVVSHQFHDLIVRILHRRLVQAAASDGDTLIFEWYPLGEGSLDEIYFCEYLGTDELDACMDMSVGHSTARLGKLFRCYSRFRPVVQVPVERPLPPPEEDPIETAGSVGQQQSVPEEEPMCQRHPVSKGAIFIGRNSYQQSLKANLAKDSLRKGKYREYKPINAGTVCLARSWLADRADPARIGIPNIEHVAVPGSDILWLDTQQTLGVRLNVELSTWSHPMLARCFDGEEIYNMFEVEIEGECLGAPSSHMD